MVIGFFFLVLCTDNLLDAANNKGRTGVSVTQEFMGKFYGKIYTFYIWE